MLNTLRVLLTAKSELITHVGLCTHTFAFILSKYNEVF